MITLKEHIKQIAKEEGFKSITEFLNTWIQNGETFGSLRDWLALERGVDKSRITIWKAFRNYLTIPYDYEDQFWYKWNAIAKAKGFKDPRHMVTTFKERSLCNDEITEELGISKARSPILIRRLMMERINGKPIPKRRYIRRKFKESRDRDGISCKNRRLVWREKLNKYGFRSLKDAVWRMRKRGYTYLKMAEVLGVTVRDLRYRRRRAGL